MNAGWLTDLTAWIWKTLKLFFDALVDLAGDMFLRTLEQLTACILFVLSLLPLPDFMKGVSLGGMLANGGSTILWFSTLFQVGPSLAMIGSATIFYFVRRVLTVGIW